jgi:hypothetical protein
LDNAWLAKCDLDTVVVKAAQHGEHIARAITFILNDWGSALFTGRRLARTLNPFSQTFNPL